MTVLSDFDVAFVSEVSDWMYSFVTYVENEEEAKDSMTKLKDVITAAADGDVRKSLVDDTLYLLEIKFEDQLVRMGNWRYMTKWSG